MLNTVLVLGALAVVFWLAWRALRKTKEPAVDHGGDAYMRNVRAIGTLPHSPVDPMKPIFPPPQPRD